MKASQVKAVLFARIAKVGNGYSIPAQYNRVYTARAADLQKEKLIVNTKNGFVLTKDAKANFESKLQVIQADCDKLVGRQSYVAKKAAKKVVKPAEKKSAKKATKKSKPVDAVTTEVVAVTEPVVSEMLSTEAAADVSAAV